MKTVTISPKYQIVIPQAIRNALGLQPGQKIQAILYEDRIELIPVKSEKVEALNGDFNIGRS